MISFMLLLLLIYKNLVQKKIEKKIDRE
jgi:hypothetical protein